MSCDFSERIRFLVLQWLDNVLVNLVRLSNHLIQFSHFSKHVRSSLHIIWPSHVWVTSKEINSRIFRHKEESQQYLIDKAVVLLVVEGK